MKNLELRSNALAMSSLAEKIKTALAQAGYQNRADALAAIESGRLEYIEFAARVFVSGPNTNNLTFADADMPAFAESFAGQPHLRNHNTRDIDARDGTTQISGYNAGSIDQMIRLTTRRGMTDFIEGKIDRFSIGWRGDALLCTICNQSWFSAGCSHRPGQEYDTASGKKKCQLLTVNPRGKETSSVNDPAVESETGLLESLESMKLSINGISADDHQQGEQMFKIPKPMFEADKGAGAGSTAAAPSSAAEQLAANQLAMDALNGSNQRQQALNDQLDASNKILAAQCSQFLTTALQGSRLPDVVQTRLRRQFDGKVFEAPALQVAIDEARAEVSALTAGQSISGPGRGQISSMFNNEDQFKAAFDDLMGAPRDPGKEGIKVHRLTGLREAYLLGTGDVDFVGGYHPLQLGGTTADFPGAVKDSLNKMLVRTWNEYGTQGYNWWEPIVTVEHVDNLNDVDWIVTGTVGSLPTVAEQGDYTELPIGDSVETSAFVKSGGYIPLTLEAILRDDIRAFRRFPIELAKSARRNISSKYAAIFTANSGAGPTMADGGALFNATGVTTAGGHANLLTTAIGTDYVAWEAVAAAMYDQPMPVKNETGHYGTGAKQAVDPAFILVPRALRGSANNLFISRSIPGAQITVTTGREWIGQVTPLTVPEWTDANNYAAVAPKSEVAGLMMAEIFGVIPQVIRAGGETDPAMFSNDEVRLKVRQILATGVADFRGLHKSNVA